MTGTLVSGEGEGEGEDGDNGECCTIDEKYIKNTLKLLVLGGYVKYWAAFKEFKEWFKERGFNLDFDTSTRQTLTPFVFEDYEIIES